MKGGGYEGGCEMQNRPEAVKVINCLIRRPNPGGWGEGASGGWLHFLVSGGESLYGGEPPCMIALRTLSTVKVPYRDTLFAKPLPDCVVFGQTCTTVHVTFTRRPTEN